MARTTYIDAITTALAEEMRLDPRVFVIGNQSLGNQRIGNQSTGNTKLENRKTGNRETENRNKESGKSRANGSEPRAGEGGGKDAGSVEGPLEDLDNLYSEFGAGRVLDSRLADGVIVSSAIGAALAGMRPVPEIHLSGFDGAMDAITQQAAKVRYRSGGAQTCPITIRIRYGNGGNGGPYHSRANTTCFAHEPGLIVACPGTVYDAKGMLKAAIRSDDPVVYLEHLQLYHSIEEELPEEDFVVELGKAAVRREGSDMTVISYGYMLQLSLQAADKLRQVEGVEVEVVDLRTLAPLDTDTFLNSVAKTNRVCIVHEDRRTLGMGAEISAIIAEQAFDCLDAPIVRVTAPDVPAFPSSPPLQRFYMPSLEKIMDGFMRVLKH